MLVTLATLPLLLPTADPDREDVAEALGAYLAARTELEQVEAARGALAEALAFELDPDDRERAQALLLEAGLVVAFLVDGDCEPVRAAHAALRQELVERRLRRKTVTALVEVLLANEDALRAFAELE